MQIKYFQTAWNDVKNSPGWFGKMCLLALVNFIPIFGSIVTYGYLYGWAREIAWGVHQPMPASIFSNDDGKFWRRGWFLFVIAFVFSLIPSVITYIGTSMQGPLFYANLYGYSENSALAGAGSAASAGIGALLYIVGMLLALVITIPMWVAFMRSAIYDRLSPGFQLGKIWSMMRKDTGGIMRIFGMNLLLGLILSVVITIVVTIGVLAIIAVGYGASGGGDPSTAAIAGIGGIAALLLIAFIFFAVVAGMAIEAIVARAVGYWTMQFDVPHWRGQDDSMPFEQMPPASGPQYPMN